MEITYFVVGFYIEFVLDFCKNLNKKSVKTGMFCLLLNKD